ncbi:MAG: ABC transporter ATP-binding protein [Pseudomonadota bacterium]|uniref:ABC transporter ATP-binding protein n=1 Tax=Alcanivorax sp. TaxID=1872427 RepID=UPI002437D37A|nr:ABC transporter ATP-binding protein [Alcanivorax sp.]MED5238275.1 ABC transporter ATP-binding protein [Pseudomonadota bacterium]MEE3320121.1 ABC transporter ATP-binding protein [Pseudomonadota bacterium]
MNDTSPVLSAQHLGKEVNGPEGNLKLLQNITFDVFPGDSVAITGPSGSGKSTLLSLLAGLDTPTSGLVTLKGESFSDLNEDQRARRRGQHCGFVFQQFQLVADLTAIENVMLPLEILGRSGPRKTAQQWLEQVGLGKRQHHYPAQLSGGEQQRVALARAFAVSPALLFADEPTGSLDYANGQHVADLLFQLNKEQGTALVLVTHDPALAERCQHAFTLNEGQLSD